MNLASKSGSGRSVVLVLDEWAKLAPDTNRSVFGSDWLSETNRICLISTYAEDEWLRHRNQPPAEWRISAGFRGSVTDGFSAWGRFCAGGFGF
jgi:hypothetical protein